MAINGNTADVQPLTKIKQYGKNAENQAVVTGVPILKNAMYKISSENIEGKNIAVLKSIEKGDTVLCVVCERDITDAKKGISSLPAIRRHDISDSVIIGVL